MIKGFLKFFVQLNFPSYNKCMKGGQGKEIEEYVSSTIEVQPFAVANSSNYRIRSECFFRKGDMKSAIGDLSKSLFLDPNYETYVRRGKLYASSSMFVYALMDFEEASNLYKREMNEEIKTIRDEGKEQQETREFLQKSLVIQKLPQLKEIAKKQEKDEVKLPEQLNEQFITLMNQMIEQKFQNQQKQQQKYDQLIKLIEKQEQKIKQLEGALKDQPKDYELIFYKEMEQSTISVVNKQKCMIYFHTVLSELEEYYLAAKVLQDIDEKKLRFEDYESIEKQTQKSKKLGAAKGLVEKLFKLFEKNEGKLERAGEIVKEIPYIGTTFKLIKSATKGFTWFDSIKVETECQNILALRPNVTSFNAFACRFGYELYRNYKVTITLPKPSEYSTLYKHSYWEKLAKGYKNFRKKQIGARVFKNISQVEKDYIYEMAQIHASIFMVGVGYGFFKIPYGASFPDHESLQRIFSRMAEVEKKLLETMEEKELLEIEMMEFPKSFQKDSSQKERVCSVF